MGASDLTSALRSRGPLKHLSRMNRRGGLKWDIPKHFLDVTKRFEGIGYDDWVFVYFDNTLSLAKVSGGIRSNAKHPLNRSGEIFKYRKIKRKKSFSLDHLPDAFRLLRAAGRGNIFQLHGSRGLVELLGSARNESPVKALLARKELVELLELLGPTNWESVCQAISGTDGISLNANEAYLSFLGTNSPIQLDVQKKTLCLGSATALGRLPRFCGVRGRCVDRSSAHTNPAVPNGRPVCVDRRIAASTDGFSFALRNARQLSPFQCDCHSSRASHPGSISAAQWAAALDHIQDSDSATRPARTGFSSV